VLYVTNRTEVESSGTINFIRHYVCGKMNVKNTNLSVFLMVVILKKRAINICN
jgi:hypothetical protein